MWKKRRRKIGYGKVKSSWFVLRQQQKLFWLSSSSSPSSFLKSKHHDDHKHHRRRRRRSRGQKAKKGKLISINRFLLSSFWGLDWELLFECVFPSSSSFFFMILRLLLSSTTKWNLSSSSSSSFPLLLPTQPHPKSNFEPPFESVVVVLSRFYLFWLNRYSLHTQKLSLAESSSFLLAASDGGRWW